MQALIRHGVDVNAPDSNGCTALHSAAMGDKVGAIDVLIEAGAIINVQGGDNGARYTPLHMASKKGSSKAALSLVKHGADVHRSGRMSSILRRVSSGLSFSGRSRRHCDNLDPARGDCRRYRLTWVYGLIQAIVSMLRYGARVDAKDDDGDTPLHAATWCSEGIRTLVEYGADVEALTANGRTPLALAATWGCEDGAKLLLEAGADVNAPADYADGSAALSLANLGDCNVDDIMKVLIQHGADVNARDTDGLSALHHAAFHNEVDGIDVLISAGAIIEAPDKHKSTPLAVAFRSAVHRWKNKHNCGVEEFSAVIAL
ncbi:unnamed protein product, partial [Ectocarpus fasciculatus]